MALRATRLPPGPRGLPFVGVGLELRRDPLKFFTGLRTGYGDVIHVRLPFGQSRVLVNHPELIEQILVVDHQKYEKSPTLLKVTARILGKGLLTSEGEFWRRQRRISQPLFQRTHIAKYAETMVARTQEQIATWHDGDSLDISDEMMRLTMGIAVKTLFGSEAPAEARRVGQELATVMRYELRRMRSAFKIPASWPTPLNRRVKEAYAYLDSVVYGMINERRATGTRGDDLLSRLIIATDEDGSTMTPKQLRDEVMTHFLAGHETTALAMTWTWFLLAENPRTEIILHEELAQVLQGRPPRVEDLTKLPYLEAVLRESMRLYPPAWIMSRSSIERVKVGAFEFSPGTTVLMSPWVMHRDPRFFEDPQVFRPERWLEGRADKLPAYAYFPFGGGPRRCIGQEFALMEAGLLLAVIAPRFRFRLAKDHQVIPEPLVTLRPKNGVRVTVHPETARNRANHFTNSGSLPASQGL
ncbi:MAG: cytochrome P450 [Candidatus Acidiferrales bacterium]